MPDPSELNIHASKPITPENGRYPRKWKKVWANDLYDKKLIQKWAKDLTNIDPKGYMNGHYVHEKNFSVTFSMEMQIKLQWDTASSH